MMIEELRVILECAILNEEEVMTFLYKINKCVIENLKIESFKGLEKRRETSFIMAYSLHTKKILVDLEQTFQFILMVASAYKLKKEHFTEFIYVKTMNIYLHEIKHVLQDKEATFNSVSMTDRERRATYEFYQKYHDLFVWEREADIFAYKIVRAIIKNSYYDEIGLVIDNMFFLRKWSAINADALLRKACLHHRFSDDIRRDEEIKGMILDRTL